MDRRATCTRLAGQWDGSDQLILKHHHFIVARVIEAQKAVMNGSRDEFHQQPGRRTRSYSFIRKETRCSELARAAQ